MGRMVLGKTVCENYKTKAHRHTEPEEQFVFEGRSVIIDEETWHNVQRIRETKRRQPKREAVSNRLTGLLYCADCGAKMTFRSNMVQGKWLDEAFICGSYRHLTRDCTMHYISAKKIEAALLSAIQRVSWYVRSNERSLPSVSGRRPNSGRRRARRNTGRIWSVQTAMR